jgi:hypothetical protein
MTCETVLVGRPVGAVGARRSRYALSLTGG